MVNDISTLAGQAPEPPTNSTTAKSGGSRGSGIIGSIASFLGNLYDNYKIDKRQQESNQRYDYYYERNLAYNHPKAQMERLAEAGLNPNLLYGQIDSSGPSSLPQQNASIGHNPNYANTAMSVAQIAQINAATRNIEANTHKTEIESGVAEQQINTQKELERVYHTQAGLNVKQSELVSQEIVNLTKKFDEVQANIDLIRQQINNLKGQEAEQNIHNFILDESKYYKIFQNIAESNLSQGRWSLFCDTYAHQVLGYELDNKSKEAYINLSKAQKSLTDEQIEATIKYATNLHLQNTDLSNVINSKAKPTENGFNVYQMSADMIRWSYENRNVHFWAEKGIDVANGILGIFSHSTHTQKGSMTEYEMPVSDGTMKRKTFSSK